MPIEYVHAVMALMDADLNTPEHERALEVIEESWLMGRSEADAAAEATAAVDSLSRRYAGEQS
jgi:hypothetical protein